MRVLGIDPGITGALVILDNDEPIEWLLMPSMVVGKHNRVHGSAIARWINHIKPEMAIMELVGAMPKQGVTSMFSFGHSAGTVSGVLEALFIPTAMVTPQYWKKCAGMINKSKDEARSHAIHLWPQWRELDKKGVGQALADAALIARYGR